VNTYKSCKILGSAGTHKTPAALNTRHLLKRKRDITKLLKTKETANTNITNPNQMEDNEYPSETQIQHSINTETGMSASKQPKLEVATITENTDNHESELHSELIIDEKVSVDHETEIPTQPPKDVVDETIQKSTLEPVNQNSDKLAQIVNQLPDNSSPLLQDAIYQSQVKAEMRRRTTILAERALKFEELATTDFLRKFEHLQPDIIASYLTIQEIVVKHKNPITPTERTLYNQYKGFMFQKQLESRLARIEELKVVLDTPVPEYSDGTPIMHLTDTPCPHCRIGHKTGSTVCNNTQLLTNMTKEQLKTNHTWRDKVKAVVISNKALVDLPVILKDNVINIQVPCNLTYWVTPGHTEQADKTSQLYTEIMEILQLIGTENTYLVFIEFLRSHSNETALEYQHLAFVRTCRELQINYGGLIIPVLGLHRPDKGETTAKYLESKYRLTSCFGGAFAAGRWLGIPVDLPNIQNGAPHRESQRKFSPPWRNEPLFNSDAEPTREWYRRITIYLMARLSLFKPYYPMTDKHGRRIKLAIPSYTATPTIFL